eukprot:scaffold8902_cov63-Phaeocystis_antarctica.AAC.1
MARPDRHGQGASRQREADRPPLLRPREPPPLDAGRAPSARQAGPASLLCARCVALQPPCAAWACVLRLLYGRRCRSKIVSSSYESWTSQCGGQCGSDCGFSENENPARDQGQIGPGGWQKSPEALQVQGEPSL